MAMSDIENVMVYFNINQVEKERYYGKIHIRKRKDTMKEKRYDERKRYYENDTYEKEKRCTNEKRYTLIYVGIRYESLKNANKNEKTLSSEKRRRIRKLT